ncbi:dihydroorotase [Aerococcus kribbianus]|uniref:Dihydroorotase n=1 Tax=Aerococcus kribbianus TaxID=2999064 RepID=A0A9X3FRQ5_9LACT|nr:MULTISPECIES: dihydroorotase [unclassified Aerococcus]MCZ0717152.1 dihydroorotase [Aerococcus sp. YH-aer221]MCZ0725440.1 dihydroorotase [Aerococcus sp. YH-aer222]
MLVIKNARLVDSQVDCQVDLLIDQGKIVAIGQDLQADQVIDGQGQVLMPAFVDTHVHFRDPGFTAKEDLQTGMQSALRGGYGAVNLMANTKPVVDHPEVYQDIMDRAQALDLIAICQSYAVSKNLAGIEWVDFDQIPDTVKFLSDDGHGLHQSKQTYDLFKELAKRDLAVMIHEEDDEISPIDYRIAEDIDTIRDVYLSGKTGARVHFCHVSTIDAMEAIIAGKKKGYPITAEVTPHHLYLADFDYQVNPPIRSQADVDFLISAALRGEVDCIATDHAPHTETDKFQGSPGLVGLETAFYIIYKVLVENHGASLSLLSRLMSQRPAEILAYDHKGRLKIGYDADLVMINLNEQTQIQAEDMASKSHNSPFIGESFTGKITHTIIGGQVKYQVEQSKA